VSSLKPYFQLARPANIVTAIADILAGMTIAQFIFEPAPNSAYWLIPATIGLYGGGVVMNDVFDAKLDAVERPDRPIPSGKVIGTSCRYILGVGLLLLGVLAAAQFSLLSAEIAFCSYFGRRLRPFC
jgi:4-hydroxybenzoate polyprenyltransferase